MFYKFSTLGLSDVLTLFLITVSDQGTEQPRKLTYFLSEPMKRGVSWVALVKRKKLEKRYDMARGQQITSLNLAMDIVENELPIKPFGGKANENIVLLGYG